MMTCTVTNKMIFGGAEDRGNRHHERLHADTDENRTQMALMPADWRRFSIFLISVFLTISGISVLFTNNGKVSFVGLDGHQTGDACL